MRILNTVLIGCVLGLWAASPATAQWSSNIPGVPRASVPLYGSSQGRFELDLTGVRIQEPDWGVVPGVAVRFVEGAEAVADMVRAMGGR